MILGGKSYDICLALFYYLFLPIPSITKVTPRLRLGVKRNRRKSCLVVWLSGCLVVLLIDELQIISTGDQQADHETTRQQIIRNHTLDSGSVSC